MVQALNAIDIRNTNPMSLFERDLVYDARSTPTAQKYLKK